MVLNPMWIQARAMQPRNSEGKCSSSSCKAGEVPVRSCMPCCLVWFATSPHNCFQQQDGTEREEQRKVIFTFCFHCLPYFRLATYPPAQCFRRAVTARQTGEISVRHVFLIPWTCRVASSPTATGPKRKQAVGMSKSEQSVAARWERKHSGHRQK